MGYLSFSPSREVLLSRASLASGRRMGYFLAVVGVVLLGVADYAFCRERIFLSHALLATAHVVEMREQRSRLGLHSAPVLAYADRTGKEWQVVTGGGVGPAASTLGQAVEVFYRPDDPGNGQLGGFFGRWGLALGCGIAGAVLTSLGYVGTGVFEWLERTTRFP